MNLIIRDILEKKNVIAENAWEIIVIFNFSILSLEDRN